MTKVLLVEDNEMNRDMLSRRLARKGYEVVMAVDGEQAVALATAERPDRSLMDRSLPGIDRWEAKRGGKAADPTPRVPAIGPTAQSMVGERQKAVGVSCSAGHP